MAPWPRQIDYDVAILQKNFEAPSLKICEVKLRADGTGKPSFSGGRNAITYKVTDKAGKNYAIKVFREKNVARSLRYTAISKFVSESNNRYFSKFAYQEKGLQASGQLVPLLQMEWVEGKRLHAFIGANVGNISSLRDIAKDWIGLSLLSEQSNISHGDLHHGNIIVAEKEIKLIDYDGMFVPSLRGQPAIEVGNEHYQHPLRQTTNFDQYLDRFSHIVIYISILIATFHPDIYLYDPKREYLFFSRKDFLDPRNSPILAKLCKLPEYQHMVNNFINICLTPMASTPSLEKFLESSFDAKSNIVKQMHMFEPYKAASGGTPPIRLPPRLQNALLVATRPVKVVTKIDTARWRRWWLIISTTFALATLGSAGVIYDIQYRKEISKIRDLCVSTLTSSSNQFKDFISKKRRYPEAKSCELLTIISEISDKNKLLPSNCYEYVSLEISKSIQMLEDHRMSLKKKCVRR